MPGSGTTLAEGNSAMATSVHLDLRAVIYFERSQWIAHCLELDIVAQGKSAEAALDELAELCATQVDAAIEAGDLQSVLVPAPPETWQLYFGAHSSPSMTRQGQGPLHRLEARALRCA